MPRPVYRTAVRLAPASSRSLRAQRPPSAAHDGARWQGVGISLDSQPLLSISLGYGAPDQLGFAGGAQMSTCSRLSCWAVLVLMAALASAPAPPPPGGPAATHLAP